MRGVDEAVAISPGKDLEVGDGILDLEKGRIQADFLAEVDPRVPVGRGFAGTRRNDSVGDLLCCKAEIAEEIMSGCSW